MAGQFFNRIKINNCSKFDSEVCPSKPAVQQMRSRAVPIMHYVYLIRSINNPSKIYIGYTTNLKQRLDTHNSGGSIHTESDRLWKLMMYLAFDSEIKALNFEKYIKVVQETLLQRRDFGNV